MGYIASAVINYSDAPACWLTGADHKRLPLYS
jgi:hypothetical protein